MTVLRHKTYEGIAPSENFFSICTSIPKRGPTISHGRVQMPLQREAWRCQRAEPPRLHRLRPVQRGSGNSAGGAGQGRGGPADRGTGRLAPCAWRPADQSVVSHAPDRGRPQRPACAGQGSSRQLPLKGMVEGAVRHQVLSLAHGGQPAHSFT